MIRSTDITSSTELRQNLRVHLDRLKTTGRPLYITTNGETEAIMLSTATFDELIEKLELAESLATIDRSMEDIKAGRVRDFREGIRSIADKLGLKLDP